MLGKMIGVNQMENKYVAVDLDGCIAEYDGWKGEEHVGEPKDWSRSSLEALKSMGFQVIVHTCRNDLRIVEDYLEEYDLPYDYINKNPEQPPTAGTDKVFAHYYIDDRNVFHKGLKEAVMQISTENPPNELKCEDCLFYGECKRLIDPDEELIAEGCLGYMETYVEVE